MMQLTSSFILHISSGGASSADGTNDFFFSCSREDGSRNIKGCGSD